MTGSPERQKSLLPHLGEWFSGNLGRLGVQREPLEQRLKDPTKSLGAVRDYWLSGRSIKPEESIIGARMLQEQIRTGTANNQLIPILDAALSGRPIKEFLWAALLRGQELESPTNGYSLYSMLISGADTVESVPYLLQALKSSVVVRADTPYESSAPKRLGERYKVEKDEICIGGSGWYRENLVLAHVGVVYEEWSQRNKYHARKPYAEMALSRLMAITEAIAGSTDSRRVITEAIERFESTKPPFIELDEHHQNEVSRTTLSTR